MCHGQERDSLVDTFCGCTVDKYRVRDGMVYYRGSMCSTHGLKLWEVIARGPHDALLVRRDEELNEHEVQWMVDLVYT